jgi:uncharacterized membrane protein YdjX (TVP38/TMEM64 family)
MKNDRAKPAAQAVPAARLWPKVFVFFAIIAAWYGLSRVLPLETWLLDVLAWIKGLGPWGPVIFVLLYIPSCVLMFPDILLNAAAGAIWGVGVGTVAVSLGRVLGSAATFLLARNIAGRWIEGKMAADAGRFAAVAEVVGRQGFRIVTLLRLCPLFPAIMLNYALGLTRVSLMAYAAGTLIGMIPRTLLVAYIGSGTRSLADLATGDGMNVTNHPMLYWGGLVLSLAIVMILANKARRLINDATR